MNISLLAELKRRQRDPHSALYLVLLPKSLRNLALE